MPTILHYTEDTTAENAASTVSGGIAGQRIGYNLNKVATLHDGALIRGAATVGNFTGIFKQVQD